jgi:hypothetical protein
MVRLHAACRGTYEFARGRAQYLGRERLSAPAPTKNDAIAQKSSALAAELAFALARAIA